MYGSLSQLYRQLLKLPFYSFRRDIITKNKLRYRDTKYNLCELQGAKYYILSNTYKKVVEVFELLSAKIKPKHNTHLYLTTKCTINFDVLNLWQSM